jgi:hypothetical protein
MSIARLLYELGHEVVVEWLRGRREAKTARAWAAGPAAIRGCPRCRAIAYTPGLTVCPKCGAAL